MKIVLISDLSSDIHYLTMPQWNATHHSRMQLGLSQQYQVLYYSSITVDGLFVTISVPAEGSLLHFRSARRVLCYLSFFVEGIFVTVPVRAKSSLLPFLLCLRVLWCTSSPCVELLVTLSSALYLKVVWLPRFKHLPFTGGMIPISPSGLRLVFHIHGSDWPFLSAVTRVFLLYSQSQYKLSWLFPRRQR
jgi:hypothetical protein